MEDVRTGDKPTKNGPLCHPMYTSFVSFSTVHETTMRTKLDYRHNVEGNRADSTQTPPTFRVASPSDETQTLLSNVKHFS